MGGHLHMIFFFSFYILYFFCHCMSWGSFNILWCHIIPNKTFPSFINGISSQPWPVVNMELRNAFTFIGISAVSTLFLPSLSILLICLLHNVFNVLGEKSYLSLLYSLCPFSIFESSSLISASTCFIPCLTYNAFLSLITLCRSDFIQAGIFFSFSPIQLNEMQKDWTCYAEIPYEQTFLLCFHKPFTSNLLFQSFYMDLYDFIVWGIFF